MVTSKWTRPEKFKRALLEQYKKYRSRMACDIDQVRVERVVPNALERLEVKPLHLIRPVG